MARTARRAQGGLLADSTFWRELAREFCALPDDNTYVDQVIDPISDHPFLKTSPKPQWMLHSNSHHVAVQFEVLARRAGDGFSPDGPVDLFQAWMDALWGFNVNADTHKDATGREPYIFVEVKKRIRDLSRTSCLLCRHLENDAVNEERARRAEKAVSLPSVNVIGVPPAEERAPLAERQVEPSRSSEQKVRQQRGQPVRSSPIYTAIYKALRQIAESRPRTQEQVFQALEARHVALPTAKPFANHGWLRGFQMDEGRARSWLSKTWAKLKLPALPRGPKNRNK
jgi:hypothetical protein